MTRKQRMVAAARSLFPGRTLRVRQLGGVDELVVSDTRNPKESLAASVLKRRYLVVSSGEDFEFKEVGM